MDKPAPVAEVKYKSFYIPEKCPIALMVKVLFSYSLMI